MGGAASDLGEGACSEGLVFRRGDQALGKILAYKVMLCGGLGGLGAYLPSLIERPIHKVPTPGIPPG